MRIVGWLALAALWAGCAYTQEKFNEDYQEAFCAYDASCASPFYASLGDCRSDVQQSRDVECIYDVEQAKACMDALDGLECEGPLANFPSVCNDVCY